MRQRVFRRILAREAGRRRQGASRKRLRRVV